MFNFNANFWWTAVCLVWANTITRETDKTQRVAKNRSKKSKSEVVDVVIHFPDSHSRQKGLIPMCC